MPDKDGKLTDEDRNKVIAWLGQYPPALGANSPCPICGSTTWMIGEYLVQPITLGPNITIQLGGPSYPQVMLISVPCGYTRFINAVIMGILQPDKEKDLQKS